MNRIWQKLLGLSNSPGELAPGSRTRLELTALPRGGTALALVGAAVATLALLWWLYRRERRRHDLARWKCALLVGLRALVLLVVGAMLVEPVLVSTRRETVPSHLAVVV